MKKAQVTIKPYILLFLLLFFLSAVKAQTPVTKKETDTTKIVKKTDTLKYPFKYSQEGKLFLADPSISEIVFDPDLGRYIIIEKIGDYYDLYYAELRPELK